MNNPHQSNARPRDPREVFLTPQEITDRLGEILHRPAETLAEQATQLHDAHEVLQEALR